MQRGIPRERTARVLAGYRRTASDRSAPICWQGSAVIDQRRASSRGRARTWGPAARGPCPARESTREPKGKPFGLGLSSIRSTRHPSGSRRTAASINRFEVRMLRSRRRLARTPWGGEDGSPRPRPAPPRPSSSARRRPRAAWRRPPSARTPAGPTPGRSGASTPWLDGRPLEDTTPRSPTLAELPRPGRAAAPRRRWPRRASGPGGAPATSWASRCSCAWAHVEGRSAVVARSGSIGRAAQVPHLGGCRSARKTQSQAERTDSAAVRARP